MEGDVVVARIRAADAGAVDRVVVAGDRRGRACALARGQDAERIAVDAGRVVEARGQSSP